MNRAQSALVAVVLLLGCQPQMRVSPLGLLESSQQLVVVTTPDWTSTTGTLRRFERATPASEWRPFAQPTPVVVGRTGIAWGVGFDGLSADGPSKHEGDGKAPAGIFPLDTAFGFAPRDSMQRVIVAVSQQCQISGFCSDIQSSTQQQLPYAQLLPTTDCVDDTASAHYNTVVDRASVPRVDWNSAEHMRQVAQYQLGVIVGYNASPVVKGRGSCIFLHIWAGPDSHTAGCTAFDQSMLSDVMMWLDPAKRPLLVQLTASDYARLRAGWKLPALDQRLP